MLPSWPRPDQRSAGCTHAGRKCIPNYTTFDISSFPLKKECISLQRKQKTFTSTYSKVENEDVYLDADYLGRIIDNLITNAIKFSNQIHL